MAEPWTSIAKAAKITSHRESVLIMHDAPTVRPLPWTRALLFFGASAVPFWLGIYVALPALVRRGASASVALSIGFLVPLTLLLVAAVVFARRERSIPGWRGMRRRWRLDVLRWSHVGWALVLLVVTLAGYFALAGTSDWLQAQLGLRPPPELDLVQTDESFWGIALAGNWWVVLLHGGIVLLNVAGEELWFRGVLFPRQQVTHGSRTWLVHGLWYHAFHMFYPWDVIRLLPESVMYGWIAQRTNSVWPSLLSHAAFNGLGLIATVSGVLGA